ncbi:hypothetical protein [Novosphingobium sp. HII-3]|uniref:hypothetical protein n=1 Tax=Novosphingobium sp. HII-3 TaxID=2075565 RepID=UPI001E59DD0E|nr:hypothetical protein [Novosphingobium sp. HII-3]
MAQRYYIGGDFARDARKHAAFPVVKALPRLNGGCIDDITPGFLQTRQWSPHPRRRPHEATR